MHASAAEEEKKILYWGNVRYALQLKSTDTNRQSAKIKPGQYYMKKPSVSFGVCMCCWSGETNSFLRKQPLKYMYCVGIVIHIYRCK